jgi:hypothetical protein
MTSKALLELQPIPSFAETLRPDFANRISLGFEGLYAPKNSHVLLLAEQPDSFYVTYLSKMILTGLQNPFERETCVLSLSKGQPSRDLVRALAQPQSDRLCITSWEETEQACLPGGNFSPEADAEWVVAQAHQCRKQGSSFLRIVNEECAELAAAMTNRDDYFQWEKRMRTSIEKSLGDQRFMQVCVYKLGIVEKTFGAATPNRLASIIAAHDIIVYVNGETVLNNHAAVDTLLRRYRPQAPLQNAALLWLKRFRWLWFRWAGWIPERTPLSDE